MKWSKKPKTPSPGAEPHGQGNQLGDFILGWQDGLVNVLGITLGLAAAGQSVHILLLGGLAATFAEAVSMGAVAYTSMMARHDNYLAERAREEREMRDVPEAERSEVRQVFHDWGFSPEDSDVLTEKISANPKAWLEFMMAHELKLQPIEESAVRRSAVLVFFATLIGSLIPLAPVLVLNNSRLGSIWALVISAGALFGIGWYGARLTVGSPSRSGLQLAVIGIVAGIAGFAVGILLGGGPV
ncbi:MAG: VIT1/CCC1 transporter family protein [Thermoplasmata archaeon]